MGPKMDPVSDPLNGSYTREQLNLCKRLSRAREELDSSIHPKGVLL